LTNLRLDGAFRIRELRIFNMAFWQRTSCFLFLYLVALAASVSAQTESTVPTLESIVARIAQARSENRARYRGYRVTRNYELFGEDRTKTQSQVTADITFVPPDVKKYVIDHASGSGLGQNVVRLMLDNETEVARDYRLSDVSTDNYDFRFVREENINARNCYLLELLPKRNDKNLLTGKLWVDAETYLFRRIEGGVAKTPSWWLKEVRIKIFYGDVNGMWLPTASESVGDVRILGKHTVITRDMKYEVGTPGGAVITVPVSFVK
jgi:outer membrane lipoprotein-sorting protein